MVCMRHGMSLAQAGSCCLPSGKSDRYEMPCKSRDPIRTAWNGCCTQRPHGSYLVTPSGCIGTGPVGRSGSSVGRPQKAGSSEGLRSRVRVCGRGPTVLGAKRSTGRARMPCHDVRLGAASPAVAGGCRVQHGKPRAADRRAGLSLGPAWPPHARQLDLATPGGLGLGSEAQASRQAPCELES